MKSRRGFTKSVYRISDPVALEYLKSFYNDLAIRNKAPRHFLLNGVSTLLMPGVFPTDSPLSYSTESILRSVLSDVAKGVLRPTNIHHICDVGTGSGVFLVALSKHFPDAKLVGLEIDRQSKKNASLNISQLHIDKASIRRSDLFSGTQDIFDLVVTSLPFASKLHGSYEIDVVTIKNFFGQVESRLNQGAYLYINWASWANYSIFESLFNGTKLLLSRVDEYCGVVGVWTWRTYVFRKA